MSDIGKLLFEIRTRKGISLRELEGISGVSHTSIHRWEKGTAIPQVDSLQKVFDALGYELQIVKKERLRDE